MEEAKKVLSRYRNGICTSEERELLLKWFGESKAEGCEQFSAEELRALQDTFKENFRNHRQRAKINRRLQIGWGAASLILFMLLYATITNVVLKKPSAEMSFFSESDIADIAPGGSKAVLTLSNGEQVNLETGNSGTLVSERSVSVTQEADGLLVYEPLAAHRTDESETLYNPIYNTIQTPPGGTYRIMLSDGTVVWLNNSTTLRYPVQFDRHSRVVELMEGEAFFQVSAQQSAGSPWTFHVQAADELVEVLGTEFNISAYPGEAQVTTLITGSIQIGHTENTEKYRMQPGQQAVFQNRTPVIRDVDAESVLAWKEGYFLFDDETLENIMTKVARWYDVEIDFAPHVDTQGKFWGSVSKFENVHVLLEKLELTGAVRFAVEGRRVSVMR